VTRVCANESLYKNQTFWSPVIFNNSYIMSLATHAMTKNDPKDPPPMNRNACMNGLVLHNIFKPSAFGPAEAQFPTHALFAHGQQWGQPSPLQPWTPYSTAAMPSVDVLVLPRQKAEETNDKKQASDCDVQVSYTSAEDLANVLFPTHSAVDSEVRSLSQQLNSDVDDLNAHRELVHDALTDHKKHITKVNKTNAGFKSEFKEMDAGLKDHQSHIRDLHANTTRALKQLQAHEQHINELHSSVKSLHASGAGSDMKKQVSALTASVQKLESRFNTHALGVAEKVDSVQRKVESVSRSNADMHLGLQTHTTHINKHARELNTLADSIARVDRLASAAKDTSLRSSAAQVDFTLLAPRRR
jgi:predicted  nucleic acid-binding Zn-ribbon protein